MLRRTVVVVMAAVLAAAAGCGGGGTGTTQQHPHHRGPLVWVIGDRQLAVLQASNAGLTRRLFDNTHTFVVATDPHRRPQIPSGYRSIPTATYRSEAAFARDVTTAKLHHGIAAVMYDPEHWAGTPESEQRDPARAAARFADLAHRMHLEPIYAPGRDLVALPGSACSATDGETLDDAYLRCELPSAAQGYGWFVVQSGPEELDHEVTGRLVGATADQVSGTDATLLATLSLTPQGHAVWPGQLIRATNTILARGANGIMLNFQLGSQAIAASYLRDLERLGTIQGFSLT